MLFMYSILYLLFLKLDDIFFLILKDKPLDRLAVNITSFLEEKKGR